MLQVEKPTTPILRRAVHGTKFSLCINSEIFIIIFRSGISSTTVTKEQLSLTDCFSAQIPFADQHTHCGVLCMRKVIGMFVSCAGVSLCHYNDDNPDKDDNPGLEEAGQGPPMRRGLTRPRAVPGRPPTCPHRCRCGHCVPPSPAASPPRTTPPHRRRESRSRTRPAGIGARGSAKWACAAVPVGLRPAERAGHGGAV